MTVINDLRNTLRRHDYLYYVLAEPEISDYTYDMLYKDLEKIEGENPNLIIPDSPTQCVGGASAKIYMKQETDKGNKLRTDIMNDKQVKYIGFDTETEKITYKNPLPKMMCLTYAEAGSLNGSLVTPWEHDVPALVSGWWAEGTHTIGHNMAFDLSILGINNPEMMSHIFSALDANLIHDTMLREMLLNITRHGSIEFITVGGMTMRCGYALADLEKKYLNIDRSDLKDNPDAPRTNYDIYDGIPAAEWSKLFVDYAVDDAINTELIFVEQEKQREICIKETGYDPFITEKFKVKSAFALRLLEIPGTRLDAEEVIKVTKFFGEEYLSPRLVKPLEDACLRTPPIPPMPYAKGTLDHTDECKASTESNAAANRKNKVCGCPVKMKKAEPEHSPKKPLHQYIWNLAGVNSDMEAHPADACTIALKKEDIYKQVVKNGAFKQNIIQSFTLADAVQVQVDILVSLLGDQPGDLAKDLPKGASKEDRKKVKDARLEKYRLHALIVEGQIYALPSDITLSTAKAWSETFADRDELLSIWHEREQLKKIVQEYLPNMYYTDEDDNTYPAETLRGSYQALKLTGRSGCRSHSWYPSRSDQTVDARIRPCTIPFDGNVIVSTDYNGMELCTLAQKCIDLFGSSELANKINAGTDTHAYLAAQIAFNLDHVFQKALLNAEYTTKDQIFEGFFSLKGSDDPCISEEFGVIFKADYKKKKNKDLDRQVVWGDFFKHYRTMAKPVGLGYPGMLGSATLCTIAKATYGVVMDKTMAETLKGIWLDTYPEMGLYLNYIKKQCIDPHHSPIMEEDEDGKPKKRTYYAYDTKNGMHRAKCGICEAANGTALQAPSAEGALDGLYEVQRAVWLAVDGSIFDGIIPIMFIHDEIVWECPTGDLVGERARAMEKIMVDCMELATPDVKAGAESAAMLRWSKYAEPVWSDDGKILLPWIPEPETKGV